MFPNIEDYKQENIIKEWERKQKLQTVIEAVLPLALFIVLVVLLSWFVVSSGMSPQEWFTQLGVYR